MEWYTYLDIFSSTMQSRTQWNLMEWDRFVTSNKFLMIMFLSGFKV